MTRWERASTIQSIHWAYQRRRVRAGVIEPATALDEEGAIAWVSAAACGENTGVLAYVWGPITPQRERVGSRLYPPVRNEDALSLERGVLSPHSLRGGVTQNDDSYKRPRQGAKL